MRGCSEALTEMFFLTALLGESVTPAKKLRLRRPAWAIALLLAFAVCGWGLHYKLSLYHPPANHAHGPDAKLLSQKERPVAATQNEQLAVGSLADITHPQTAAPTLAVWALATIAQNARDGRSFYVSQESPHRLDPARTRPSVPRPPPTTV